MLYVERLDLIDVVGDARDAANPNFALLGMARAARLADFADVHMACKLLAAWRGAARHEREEKERYEKEERQLQDERQEQWQKAYRQRQRVRKEQLQQRKRARKQQWSIQTYMDAIVVQASARVDTV